MLNSNPNSKNAVEKSRVHTYLYNNEDFFLYLSEFLIARNKNYNCHKQKQNLLEYAKYVRESAVNWAETMEMRFDGEKKKARNRKNLVNALPS